jgi:carbonyl reductase 1
MDRARVAVVTGANRGIGEEVARQLAAHGLGVVRTSREIRPGDGMTKLDVTRAADVESLAAALAPSGLDVLVNNAGVSLEGFDADVVRRTLDVNFFGAMRVTDALLPAIRPSGRVVMVSSGLGRLSAVGPELQERFRDDGLGREGLVELMESFVREVRDGTYARRGWPANAYSVSKVGMNALARVLARELKDDPRGIAVNSADPGWVRTRMGGRAAPRPVEEGARTPVFLALLPPGGPTGGFFSHERPTSF